MPALSPGCFAILPDEGPTGAEGERALQPLALFDTLEDALDWGSKRYPGQAFRVRFLQHLSLEDDLGRPARLAS